MSKIQFNATSAKSFRAILAQYHDARHALNDYVLQRQARVKLYTESVRLANEDLIAIGRGETGVMRSVEQLKADLAQYQSALKQEESALADARKAQSDRMEGALALITQEFYDQYCACVTSGDALLYAGYIAAFFRANGLSDANADNCARFTMLVGLANNGASSAHKTGKLTRVLTKKQFATLFINALSDCLQDEGIISAHKYAYVKPEKKAKSAQ